MMKMYALKRRVSQLEDQLDKQIEDVEVKQGRLDSADGHDYGQIAEDIALSKMKVEVMQHALDKTKDDLKSEEAVMQSPAHQDALKKMDDIKKDISKADKTITKTYDTLRSQLDDFAKLCKDYDRLNRQYLGADGNTWVMSSYRWPSYLYHRMARIVRDASKVR